MFFNSHAPAADLGEMKLTDTAVAGSISARSPHVGLVPGWGGLASAVTLV